MLTAGMTGTLSATILHAAWYSRNLPVAPSGCFKPASSPEEPGSIYRGKRAAVKLHSCRGATLHGILEKILHFSS
jgi:hypothetical protein